MLQQYKHWLGCAGVGVQYWSPHALQEGPDSIRMHAEGYQDIAWKGGLYLQVEVG